MTYYPLCRNTHHAHPCHPAYAKRYGGYCLECYNAGADELDAEVARLRAIIQAQADGCRECRGTVRAPAWGYSPAIEGPTIVGTEPCPACRWAREALEGRSDGR